MLLLKLTSKDAKSLAQAQTLTLPFLEHDHVGGLTNKRQGVSRRDKKWQEA